MSNHSKYLPLVNGTMPTANGDLLPCHVASSATVKNVDRKPSPAWAEMQGVCWM
jgi:hypothetical protein